MVAKAIQLGLRIWEVCRSFSSHEHLLLLDLQSKQVPQMEILD
ncbi:non-classical export protein Nce102 [Aspergillus luchuensis]|uniref:Non-classical export protein Nce102 n=1 Tax=Aspergillus kawachii TaxID=1069201 RepID=A0A146FVJ5_ASPKA|nr:non-classical export protein Nce102 [Aspergillus luchuensis]